MAPTSALAQLRQGYAQASRKAAGRQQPTFASLGIDPGSWLTHPAVTSDQTIAGVSTTHITAGLNVPQFLADLNRVSGAGSVLGLGSLGGAGSILSAAQRAALARSITAARVDVNAGKADHVLRQLTVRATIDTSAADRATLKGLRTGTLTLKLAFSGINQPQSIVAPAGAQPLSVLTSTLSQLASGAGATSSGSASSGSTGASSGSTGLTGAGAAAAPAPSAGSGSASGQSAYLACSQQAAGDLTKLQKCAPLLAGG